MVIKSGLSVLICTKPVFPCINLFNRIKYLTFVKITKREHRIYKYHTLNYDAFLKPPFQVNGYSKEGINTV